MGGSETTTRAMLFDMDGTLLDSTPAVEATWRDFSEQRGLNLTEVLQTTHGVRTIDNLRRWSGLTDEEELARAVDAFENKIATEAQDLKAQGKDGLILLPGVGALLHELLVSQSPVWAIVTSATAIYAAKALPTAGVPSPPFLITGDMCDRGKPDPEPYLRGAKALGLEAHQCEVWVVPEEARALMIGIVVEDAPAGIRSGVAAGCRVLAVCTSHQRSALEGLGAEWIVTDLSRVQATRIETGLHLSIDQN